MKCLLALLGALSLTSLAESAETLMVNYSLWPRRPEAISKARELIYQQKLDEALLLLNPLVHQDDIGGQEARLLTSLINLPRYLSRQNPHAGIYHVKSGDLMARIALAQKTPLDLLYMLNGVTDPARLRVGQKLVVAPMSLKLILDVAAKELRLWDGDVLVYATPLLKVKGAVDSKQKVTIDERLAYYHGRRVSLQSMSYCSSQRALKLSNGAYLLGDESLPGVDAFYFIDQQELNALSLLLNVGSEVCIARSLLTVPASLPSEAASKVGE